MSTRAHTKQKVLVSYKSWRTFHFASTKIIKPIVIKLIKVIFFRKICHSDYYFISLHAKNLNKYNIFQQNGIKKHESLLQNGSWSAAMSFPF